MAVIKRTVPEHDLPAGLHPVLRRIYAARGLTCGGDLELELAGLEPPSSLLNIDAAAGLLEDALRGDRRILIVGDFDADGATSSALGLLCLRAMGCRQADYLVPNRFEYGYGLTPEIVDAARARRPDLIMTVDNGIASFEGVRRAADYGIEVLVTDHHLPGRTLPEAACIVNPNLPDCGFPSKALAGVGVVFYLMCALRARLRDSGWFAQQGIAEPNMAGFLDLVALGTVADVVPLDRNNRRLVRHGLGVIRSGRGRPGILALLEVAGRNYASAAASDLGFAAGPRLNAAGRLDDMSLGVECLLADSPMRARDIARELDGLNRDRKTIERDMQARALEILTELSVDAEDAGPGICLYDPAWHQGVSGILASRIKDRFHRPVIVFADGGADEQGEGLIKGSARSIPGLHIRDLLDAVATLHPGLLNKFGGHAMAAGLAIRAADFEAFRAAFTAELERRLEPELLQRKTLTDGELEADCLNLDFALLLREAGPWGQHFPEPLFEGEFQVVSRRVLGEKHLKLVLQAPGSATLIDAIAFNLENLDGGEWELAERVSLVYRLDVNEYRGTLSPQLMVEQIEFLRASVEA